MNRLERVLAIFCIVARGHIQDLVADWWSDDLLVIVAALDLAQEVLQTQAQVGTFRQPQRKALANRVGEHKQFHLLAQLAVVAFLGFFEHHQILIEHLFLGERDAIYAYQLIAGFIATPVSAGKRQYLDGLDWAGRWQVRTTAQIGK